MNDNVRLFKNSFGGRLVYLKSSTTNEEYWDSLWSSFDNSNRYTRKNLPWPLRRLFRKRVEIGSRVLEAGCGLAEFTVAANYCGYKAEGLDYAPDVISSLTARFPDIQFHKGDVRNLSNIVDNHYDAVYLPGVCEHFEEGPEQILKEMYRILKPDGLLFCSTPCFNVLRRLVAKMGRYNTEKAGVFYQFAFTEAEITHILNTLNFEVVEIVHQGTFKTLCDFCPVIGKLLPPQAIKALSVLLDILPITGAWGHSCIWVARRSL